MAGTVSTPIFKQDGQYLSFTVYGAAIPLGYVVMLNNDGTVSGATTASTTVIGVAVSGNRVSRTATNDQVAVGDLVTVLTRGVVYVTVGTGSVDEGQLVEAYSTGAIQTQTAASNSVACNHGAVVGKCLVAGAASPAVQAQVLLTIV